jgi:hypothetical protein
MKPSSLLVLLSLFFSTVLYAQDKIYRKNSEVVNAKIIEISSSEIKYKLYDNPDGPIYVLEKDRITKIVYENGKTEKLIPDLKDPEQYHDQLQKAIKIDFLGPLLGYSQFTFEKSIGVGKSYELSLGVIGLGKNQQLDFYNYETGLTSVRKDPFGLFIGGGYKFSKLPDFLFGRTRFTHIMQGTYVRPQVYFGAYKENILAYKGNADYVVEKQNVNFGAVEIELGKQWVFGDKFLIEGYWGLGYGFDNKKNNPNGWDDEYSAYNYANSRLGRSPGFSVSAALKLGLLIK